MPDTLTSIGLPAVGTEAGWAAIALGTLVAVAYRIWRLLKKDRFEDRADQAEERFRNALIHRVEELEARADRFARERNQAIHEREQARLDLAACLARLGAEMAEDCRLRAELDDGAEACLHCADDDCPVAPRLGLPSEP